MPTAKELYRELKTPTVRRAKRVQVGDEIWDGAQWLAVTGVDYHPIPEIDGVVEVDFDGAGISERYRWKTRLIVR